MRRDVFQAISDPTRREIINLVAYNSLNLNAIADNFTMSRPAISQHIKILTECGLIVIRQQGRERFCEARLQQLSAVSNWLEPFRKEWEHKFGALDDLLVRMLSTEAAAAEEEAPRKKRSPKKKGKPK